MVAAAAEIVDVVAEAAVPMSNTLGKSGALPAAPMLWCGMMVSLIHTVLLVVKRRWEIEMVGTLLIALSSTMQLRKMDSLC